MSVARTIAVVVAVVVLVHLFVRTRVGASTSVGVLWSKGPYAHRGCAYATSETESLSDSAAIRAYMAQCTGVLWVRTGTHGAAETTDLDTVAESLGVLRRPVVLVTSDGDRAVPSSLRERTVRLLLESAKVTRWLTQNYDGSLRHNKLRPIPIGLDLHTTQWQLGSHEAKIAHITSQNAAAHRRKQAVLCDAHLTRSHPDRARMYEAAKGSASITMLNEKRPFADLMRLYGQYQFVLSPRGNGIDCHRTWEALLAGCIVITVTSSLDRMFAEHGFAIVVLRDWGELDEELPRKLHVWRARLAPLTSLAVVWPKMQFAYWLSDALLVGGTARDCAPFLPSVLARLDSLAQNRRVYYVFYESNSADATLSILQKFVSERSGVVYTERTEGTRTERIARGRNVVIAQVERVASSFDFFVNLDLDNVTENLDVESVRLCLSRADEWDIATASQTQDYYDHWALRTVDFGDSHGGEPYCIKHSHIVAPPDAKCSSRTLADWFPHKTELRGKRAFAADGPYYEVLSAFGGLAIYKTSLLRGARYSGTKETGDVPECEHVPFHAAIRAKFPRVRIVIAPYMITGA